MQKLIYIKNYTKNIIINNFIKKSVVELILSQ